MGNPTQLWKTLKAVGDLHMAEGNKAKALAHFQEATEVVEGVAEGLTDSSLRETFLQSSPIRRVLAQSKGLPQRPE